MLPKNAVYSIKQRVMATASCCCQGTESYHLECCHVKDTFVHPTTVLVHTRDDSSLREEIVTGNRAEIPEVPGHTEVVRQPVLY